MGREVTSIHAGVEVMEDLNRDAKNFAHVRMIADQIQDGMPREEHHDDYDPDYPDGLMSAYEWLSDVLDIEYIINSDGSFKSARVCVAFGGPTIWVDFSRGQVELWWWGEYARAGFNEDPMGIEEALECLWECR